jgi:transposase
LQHKEIRLVTRTRERHTAVQALLAEGCTRSEIGRRLGLDRHTVRRFADAATVDELLANTRREMLIDTYAPYLRQRFDDGCTDATTLLDEIRGQGFRGSIQTVRRYLQPFRGTTSTSGTRPKRPATPTPAPPTPPKPRRVATWIMTDPANLRADDQALLTAIYQRCPALQTLAEHVRGFAAMMRNLTGADLPQWMAKAMADDLPGLHSFVKGVKRDLAAVTAGLTLPWSSGPVEGQVNRVKMLKRQMFGRANFDLLRLRILQPN